MAQQMATLKACLTDLDDNTEGWMAALKADSADSDGNAEGSPD
jgi:hypothetical protein